MLPTNTLGRPVVFMFLCCFDFWRFFCLRSGMENYERNWRRIMRSFRHLEYQTRREKCGKLFRRRSSNHPLCHEYIRVQEAQ